MINIFIMDIIPEKIWYDGMNSYRKHSLSPQTINTRQYSVELLDMPIEPDRNIFQIFQDHLAVRQTKYIDILYSGGLDSELVLHTCLVNKLPMRAITMRMSVDGILINAHDMYYSEMFCRQRGIEQLVIDLNISDFFENGHYEKYLDPYFINQPHVATHFWLLEQCSGFPVLAGSYPWPQLSAFSPIRYEFNQYNRFLQDKNIHGIGSMLDYSLESTMCLVRGHIAVMKTDTKGLYGGVGRKIAKFKVALLNYLGYSGATPRIRSYGWETSNNSIYNKDQYYLILREKYGAVNSQIKWGNVMGSALDIAPDENDKY